MDDNWFWNFTRDYAHKNGQKKGVRQVQKVAQEAALPSIPKLTFPRRFSLQQQHPVSPTMKAPVLSANETPKSVNHRAKPARLPNKKRKHHCSKQRRRKLRRRLQRMLLRASRASAAAMASSVYAPQTHAIWRRPYLSPQRCIKSDLETLSHSVLGGLGGYKARIDGSRDGAVIRGSGMTRTSIFCLVFFVWFVGNWHGFACALHLPSRAYSE